MDENTPHPDPALYPAEYVDARKALPKSKPARPRGMVLAFVNSRRRKPLVEEVVEEVLRRLEERAA